MAATYDSWVRRWEATLGACARLGGDARELRIALPARPEEVEAVERELGLDLPPAFRRVLTDFSAEVEFRWFLPEKFPLPPELREIFSGECSWSLAGLADAEEQRKQWIASCFPDRDNPYDRVWHDKLGFLPVDNGDLLALDVTTSPAPVAYLSHDGSDSHGCLLGADFQDFLDRWTRLGCPGAEDWQMLPFLSGPTTFLDPYGSNAVLWRETLGLTLD